MAAVFEGFSIREYASKMRVVDVVKCWPFDGIGKKKEREEIEASLPKITRRKYRWWLDELEVVKSTSVDEERTNVVEEIEPLSEIESGFAPGKLLIEKPEADLGLKKAVLGVEEKLLMVCPVCRSFTAMTANAINAHIDRCLAKASKEERRQMKRAAAAAKAKAKTPKKRSIVEIFAVAPQIKTMEIDGNEEECSEESEFNLKVFKPLDIVVERNKKKSKSKEKALAIVRNLNLKNKEKKNIMKMKNKGKIVDLMAPVDTNKRKRHKLKVLSPVGFSGQLKGSLFSKSLEEEVLDTVAIRKKKSSSRKGVPMQNKVNTIEASRFIAKHQQHEPSVFPVHSILKNQTRVSSIQNSTAIGNLQGGEQANLHCVQQSERHVRFSDKDDILEPTKKWCSSINMHQVHSLWKELSDVSDDSSLEDLSTEGDQCFPATDEASEVNVSDEVVVSNTVGAGAPFTHKNKWLADVHGHVSVPTFVMPNNGSCQDKGKCLSDESADLNQAIENHDNFQPFSQVNSTASYDIGYAGIPRLKSTTKEGFNPHIETQAGANVQGAPNISRSLLDHFVDYEPISAALSSLENVKATAQPSASCLTMNIEPNEMHTFLSRTSTHTSNVCAAQYHPFGHLSPKDLMSNICSAVGWKTQGTAVRRDNDIDENFIGLPLNSKGELVQLHPNGRVGSSRMEKQNVRMGSSSSFPIHNVVSPNSNMGCSNVKKHYVDTAHLKDNFKFFPEKNFVEENPGIPVSSRLGITEMSAGRTGVYFQDSLRGDRHSVQQLGSNLNLMSLSYHESRKYNQTQNQTGKEKIQSEESSVHGSLHPIQPTVRLMGKDVTVGRSNKEVQGFEDGKIWTDKEIITERCPTVTVPDNPLNRHFRPKWIVHPMSQSSNEIARHTIETQRNPTSSRFLQMKDVDSRFVHSHLNWQTHLVSQNGLPMTSENNSAKLPHFTNPVSYKALLNSKPKLSEFCVSRTESPGMGSQIPVSTHIPNIGRQRLFLNSTQLKTNQGVTHGATSAFQIPFSSLDTGEYVQPFWFQSSSQSLPPWLLNATQQKEKSLDLSQLYSDTSVNHYPWTMSGANFPAISPPYHSSLISYPHNVNTSFNHIQRLPGPTSLVHPPLIPVPPGSKCISSINTSYRNRLKAKDKMKSKFFRLKDPDRAKKAKKRLQAKADDSTKLKKKPNLETRESSSAVMGLKRRVDHNVCSQYNTGAPEPNAYRNKGMVIQNDGLRTSSEVNSSKVDGMARSGPIKLSAGAKHILRPSENMDQDNSRPIHSTIPFGAVNHSGEVPGFQKKSANIYKF